MQCSQNLNPWLIQAHLVLRKSPLNTISVCPTFPFLQRKFPGTSLERWEQKAFVICEMPSFADLIPQCPHLGNKNIQPFFIHDGISDLWVVVDSRSGLFALCCTHWQNKTLSLFAATRNSDRKQTLWGTSHSTLVVCVSGVVN